jgi:hypothetical protein
MAQGSHQHRDSTGQPSTSLSQDIHDGQVCGGQARTHLISETLDEWRRVLRVERGDLLVLELDLAPALRRRGLDPSAAG